MSKTGFLKKILNFTEIIAVNLIVLLAILVIFEISLRLFWKMSTPQGDLYTNSSDHILRYELKPNASNGLVSINSDGFRDKDFQLAKDKGVFRIVVIGDSETFGKSLPLKDTISKKLEAALNSRCKKSSFEVLNMGVEGYNTIQELEFLKNKGLKYNPDLVILYYCFNDTDYPEYYFKKNFINDNFLVARYIQYRIKKGMVKRDRKKRNINSEEGVFAYLYSHDSWEYTKKAIKTISELTKSNNIKFMVMVVPEVSSAVKDFREGYPYWYINEMLDNFLKSQDIDFIEPIHLFSEQNLNPLDMVVSFEDRHKNGLANSLIAEQLGDELFKRGMISCQ